MYIERSFINMTPQMLAGLAHNAKGQLHAIFLHWTAGNYHQHFKDYHLCIDGDGKVFSTCMNLLEKKSHTWHRNSNSVGIALDCCYGAQCSRKSDEELDLERNTSVSHRKTDADSPP